METTVYSFNDVSATVSHPLVGACTTTGAGFGKISTSFMDDLTNTDLGAAGDVMISKIMSARGTVNFDIQQTSPLNKWFINLSNILVNAPASSWAAMTIVVHEKFTNGVLSTATQVALVKRPDRSNSQTGEHVVWPFVCANLTQV